MILTDLIDRALPPAAWAEGDNIPWDDPSFSERMLGWHLRQDSDAASRPSEKIDAQVRWIHESLLGGNPTRVLDLACGPGLYTSRLAGLGHDCRGIDFAPAAIAFARAAAQRDHLACSYELADVREADFGDGFGLVMMIYGQFNVFRRTEGRRLLERACAALVPGGHLLLEPQRFATVRGDGSGHTSWYTAPDGLFSAEPHLCLTESFWDGHARASTERFIIVDLATAEVTRYATSNEAYADHEYATLLGDAGFENVRLLPSLIGVEDESQSVNLAISAQKPAT